MLATEFAGKKKKKPKKPFDFSELEGDEQSSKVEIEADESSKADADQGEDIGDLNDFSGQKKKKKKKKPFNLDDLENALTLESNNNSQKASPSENDDSQPADLVVDNLDFDFTAKKKKKKKKTTFDLPDQEDFDKENEGEDFDEDLKEEFVTTGQSKWHDSDRDYTYDELLEIIYNKIKEKNPESESGTKKKLVMRPPQVLRVGTKKTSFANFLEICRSYVRL